MGLSTRVPGGWRLLQPQAEALRTMTDHGVRRLPVIDGHDLVGIVSQADIAKNLDEAKGRPAGRGDLQRPVQLGRQRTRASTPEIAAVGSRTLDCQAPGDGAQAAPRARRCRSWWM